MRKPDLSPQKPASESALLMERRTIIHRRHIVTELIDDLRLSRCIRYSHTNHIGLNRAMRFWRQLMVQLRRMGSDRSFLKVLQSFEGLISKLLSIAMVFVILMAVYDLATYLFIDVFREAPVHFSTTLFTIFGLFLNVLIALEILENITAYLKSHIIQVELVIVTSLVAVSRKIIILDLQKTTGLELIALAAAILSLSLSYWLVREMNRRSKPHDSDET